MSEIISQDIQDKLVAKVQYAKTAIVSSDSKEKKRLHMTCALYFVF